MQAFSVRVRAAINSTRAGASGSLLSGYYKGTVQIICLYLFQGDVRNSTPVCERFRHDALHDLLSRLTLPEGYLKNLQTVWNTYPLLGMKNHLLKKLPK